MTRLLKTHFTESPAWIVTVLRKNPLRSSSAGNFNPPAWLAFGGGPPATTTFVFAVAVGAASAAATPVITSIVRPCLTDIGPSSVRIWRDANGSTPPGQRPADNPPSEVRVAPSTRGARRNSV